DAAHTSFAPGERLITRDRAASLTLAWSKTFGRGPGSALVLGERALFLAFGGNVGSLDSRGGARLWSHLSCSGLGTQQPALGDGVLLVGDGGGDLAAYDPATGAQIWCEDVSGSITSAPAVFGRSVYVTNGADAVVVDQRSGSPRW